MKKFLYLFMLLIILPASVFGRLSGSGTFPDPYTGATILAVNNTSSITISETGILNAAGTKTNMSIEFDMSLITKTEVLTRNPATLWYSDGSVFIKTDLAGFENNSNIAFYDVNRKTVFSKTGINITKGETVEVPVNLVNGFFIT
jgi:hypothetical protein